MGIIKPFKQRAMSRILKLSVLSICTLTLTGCAFTNDVLQAAYDEKAEKDQRSISYPKDHKLISFPSYRNYQSDDLRCVRISKCATLKSNEDSDNIAKTN